MLITKNIKKSFGNKLVLKNIGITLQNGKITSVIGKNGAGKSTLIGIISGYFLPDSGSIEKKSITVMPDADSLFEDMTGKQFLNYILSIKKVNYEQSIKLSDMFGLTKSLNKKMSGYSFGMKKKISFIQAYLGDYDTYIFDEPTSGVDVPSARKMMQLIRKLAEKGKSILLTSHNMNELQNASDYVYILKDGLISKEGSIAQILSSNQPIDVYTIKTKNNEETVAVLDTLSIKYNMVKRNQFQILDVNINEINRIVRLLLENDVLITELEKKTDSLEEIAFDENI